MDRLAIISSESQRLADVLAQVDPERPCPTCPEWSAADLLWHLTNVHFFWAEILKRRLVSGAELPDVEGAKPSRPSAFGDLLALREDATGRLTAQLRARADDEPCWSWFPADQTVGFTRRMQTYEATMHRVDAELTADQPTTGIADDVAAGAIDHAIDVMWSWVPDDASYQSKAFVEFIAENTGQSWFVEVGTWTASSADDGSAARGAAARRATAVEPTATAVGHVSDLALWAWTRGGRVDTTGDAASVAALNHLVDAGMP